MIKSDGVLDIVLRCIHISHTGIFKKKFSRYDWDPPPVRMTVEELDEDCFSIHLEKEKKYIIVEKKA